MGGCVLLGGYKKVATQNRMLTSRDLMTSYQWSQRLGFCARTRQRVREKIEPGRRCGVILSITVLAGEGHVQRVVVVDRLERIEHFLVVVGDGRERIELDSGADWC